MVVYLPRNKTSHLKTSRMRSSKLSLMPTIIYMFQNPTSTAIMLNSFIHSSIHPLIHPSPSFLSPRTNTVSPTSINATSRPQVNPASSAARLQCLGGSRTSSYCADNPPRTVPQCMPIDLRARTSLWICTESHASAWTLDMNSRGWHSPIGRRARSKGPRRLPICLNAGQAGV